VERVAETLEFRGVPIHELAGRDPLLAGCLFVLRRVLVGTGEEEDLVSALAVEARKRIRAHLLVQMPEVGRAIHIVDGGR